MSNNYSLIVGSQIQHEIKTGFFLGSKKSRKHDFTDLSRQELLTDKLTVTYYWLAQLTSLPLSLLPLQKKLLSSPFVFLKK